MLHRFSGFELDTAAREFRTDGHVVPLQPRVFDVLAYLVEHSDRIISKEELLEELWPGVIVTDASLQRSVSLARAALKKTGSADAIRTHARHGYRFCSEAAGLPAGEDTSPSTAAADALYRDARWGDALDAYARVDAREGLGADALERWAICAQCLGNLADAILPLERAAAAHSARDDRAAAARATLALARVRMESMEVAVARGCLRRAERLLEGLALCEQHGHLAWLKSRLALLEGDLDTAEAQAREACRLGRELENPEIEAMGLLFHGIWLQATGKTRLGIATQDEAAAAVLSEEVSPLIGGMIYCGIVAGCCNAGDWRRADQWTESFSQWCRRSGIDSFGGICLLHRAEIYVVRGHLDRAQTELARSDPLLSRSAPWAVGEAHRLVGDMHFIAGDLDEAERAFRDAHAHGWDPNPGYALLLHARGHTRDAISALLRAADLTGWTAAERRASNLAHAAILSAMEGDPEAANEILERLDRDPDSWSEGTARGVVQRARGEARIAAGHPEEGLRHLYEAVQTFRNMQSVFDVASTQLRLAAVHLELEDLPCADLELSSAESAFRRAGANGFLPQCEALRKLMS